MPAAALQSLVHELMSIGRAGAPRPLADERHERWVALFDWHVVQHVAPTLTPAEVDALLRGLVLQMRGGGPAEAAQSAVEWLLQDLAAHAPVLGAAARAWVDGQGVGV
jgi:hypothetical protein